MCLAVQVLRGLISLVSVGLITSIESFLSGGFGG